MTQDGSASHSGAPSPPASPASGELLCRGEDPWGLLLAGLLFPLLQPASELFRQPQGFSYATPWRLSPLWALLLQRRSLFAPRVLRPCLPWDPLRPLGGLPPGTWNPRHLLSTEEALVWVFRHWSFVVGCNVHASNPAGQSYGSQLVVPPPTSHKELFILLLLRHWQSVRKPKVKWLLLFLKKVFQWIWPSLLQCSSHCSQLLNIIFSSVLNSIKVWIQPHVCFFWAFLLLQI